MEIQLKVSGMRCSSCTKLVESTLADIEGIDSVVANLEESMVSVKFDKNKVEQSQIIKEIEALNFKVES